MKEVKNPKPNPGVVGIVICVLMIASRFAGAAESAALGSLNTILVIVALILCLHLMRRTSALFQDHVWNAGATCVLMAFPVITLAVTVIQLIAAPQVFQTSRLIAALLILLSMPVFLCLYFFYISRKLPQFRTMRVFSRILLGLGGVFLLLRLLGDIVFPWIISGGHSVHALLSSAAAWNTYLSFAIYVLSLAGFIVLLNDLRHDAKQREE